MMSWTLYSVPFSKFHLVYVAGPKGPARNFLFAGRSKDLLFSFSVFYTCIISCKIDLSSFLRVNRITYLGE